MGHSVIHVDELDGGGPNGGVRWVRRNLGVEAFGINRFDLPPAARGVEHDESGTGQEEVCVVVAGSGRWEADGEQVDVREGSFIRFDPETTRCPVAGPNGMAFVSIGCPRGAYTPHGPF